MLAQILAHKDQILMVALTLSEILGVLGLGGFAKVAIQSLKALGAKDVSGQ